jgi:hypothetical protein
MDFDLDPNEIPDFSGDDFLHDKEIQKSRQAAQAYKKLIKDAVAIVSDELGLEPCSHKNLKTFSIFKNVQPIIEDSYHAKAAPLRLQVCVAEYTSSYPVPKNANTGSDKYFFGYIEFTKQFPKTYICRESLQIKIADLVLRQDADFREHRKFSARFHVVTENSKLLQDLFLFKDLDQLAAFPDMEVEIHDHCLVFRNSTKCISESEALAFSELAKSLVEIFS